GSAFEANACNTGNVIGAPATIGSFSACVGGVDGLLDMSGNVQEWTATCFRADAGRSQDLCPGQGGDYLDPPQEARCISADNRQRGGFYPNVGFRCCAP